jgi:hypothetical protein
MMQIKASDTWNEYQSKSLKIHLLEGRISRTAGGDLAASIDRYRQEQSELKTAASQLESRVEQSNRTAESFVEKHHAVALSVTTFQIAIALSAISALLERREYWLLSL